MKSLPGFLLCFNISKRFCLLIESISSALQDEVYIMGCSAARDLCRRKLKMSYARHVKHDIITHIGAFCEQFVLFRN